MAFTKIAAAGIGSTGTVTLENLVVTGGITAALSGTASSTTNIPNLTGAITSNNTTTSLGSFSSANLATALTDETGSGANVFATGPTLTTVTVSSGGINVTGVSTLGNTVIGGGTTQLVVTGNARITGILTIGTSSITLDGSNNQLNVGTGVTLHHTNGVQVGGNTLHSTGLTLNSLTATGVSTFTNGPILVGSATSTGTASQPLQVTGGAYVSGSFGIGTTFTTEKLDVNGNIVPSVTGTYNLGSTTKRWNEVHATKFVGNAVSGTTDLLFSGNLKVGNGTTENYIVFHGTTDDGSGNFNHTYIGERIYETGTERSELLLFKGNDVVGNPGPDRIRLSANEIRFDTYTDTTNTTGTFSQVAGAGTNKVIILSSGNVGVGTINPTSKLHVIGDGNFTGGITVGVTTSITVGSAFIKNNAVGLGTTNTTGRNAGISTAAGTLIFNVTNGRIEFYDGNAWVSIKSFDATGGTITFSGGKTIHTFTGSGTFNVNSGVSDVEYLVVAGGGGGGTDRAGGGGAGGFRTGSGFSVSPGPYGITVGGGGGGSTTDPLAGSDGASSSFGPTITSTGGGGGGSEGASVGRPGGSGGGSSYNTESFGSGTANQGNRGGSGTGGSPGRSSGGGGGAGAVGTNGTNSAIPIPGGAGLSSTISGITTFYAGGGGAADNRDGLGISLAGAGGIGGGGAGGVGNGGAGNNGAAGNGQNGTANTGGGGGGAFNFDSSGIGGSGGSGIVIIAYPS